MADDAKTSEPILKEARERFRESDEATARVRKAAHDDIDFARLANQWPEPIKKQRADEGRPCLTINRLPGFIRQVVNDSRQNKPAIRVAPVDNGADVDTAEVVSGLIRAIERRSSADVAYDTAIDHAASCGFGFFQIGIDYCHAESFDLECRIARIADPLSVHWDPRSTRFDAADWSFAFVSELLEEDEFARLYPKAAAVSFEGADGADAAPGREDGRIRLAAYWSRAEKTRRILKLSNGMVIREREYAGEVRAFLDGQGVTVVSEREATYHEVTRRLISGVEVLEEEDWPGSTIPICPVWGEEVVFGGERYFRSMIRDARDPQAMFNFWRTASTELVALAPRAPWVGPKGFVPPDSQAKWEAANSRSWAYLEYDPTAGAPPQRQGFAGIPAGALQEALNASDDMKAVTGIYDASLGARSNETSGRAILARQREGDVSNFHFIDNLARAIKYAGQVLVEIIPSVYSTRQAIRILGEDMSEKVIRLRADGATPGMSGTPGEKLYDLSAGIYDVDVKVGPSYSTQREETRETLIEVMRAVPEAAPVLGDVLMEHMDFRGAERIAKRLKSLLPPAVQQAEGLVPPAPPVPGAPR